MKIEFSHVRVGIDVKKIFDYPRQYSIARLCLHFKRTNAKKKKLDDGSQLNVTHHVTHTWHNNNFISHIRNIFRHLFVNNKFCWSFRNKEKLSKLNYVIDWFKVVIFRMHIALQSHDININHICYVVLCRYMMNIMCLYIFQARDVENVVYVENITCGDCERPFWPQIQWSTKAPLNFIALTIYVIGSRPQHTYPQLPPHNCLVTFCGP